MSKYKHNLISKGAKTIPYNPAYRKIAKNMVGCILFQQLEYWFSKNSGKTFFKYLSPCSKKGDMQQCPKQICAHQKCFEKLYRDGDSWTEELGISELKFRTAFDGIGIRYGSKTEYLKAAGECREFHRGDEEVLYCSYHEKKTGLTYYFRNHRYVDERIAELLAVDEETSSTVDKDSEPIEMRKPHLPYNIYTENTSEIITTTGTAVVVPSGNKEKDPTKSVSPVEMKKWKDIMATTIGTPLEGQVPESVIPTLLRDYTPGSHSAHQPETAAEGIKRLIRWTAAQMADPKAAPIENVVAFLRARARQGMDMPAALKREDLAAEARRRENEERKQHREKLETLKNEREIPPEARRELDRLLGRQKTEAAG